MGILLTTDYKGVKVIKKEKTSQAGNTYYQCSLMTSSKKNDEWITGFIDCTFKKADMEKVNNKAVIKIKNAFPTVDEYQGKKSIRWMITDFEILEEGEKPTENSGSLDADCGSDGFMNIPDGVADELPFA